MFHDQWLHTVFIRYRNNVICLTNFKKKCIVRIINFSDLLDCSFLIIEEAKNNKAADQIQ